MIFMKMNEVIVCYGFLLLIFGLLHWYNLSLENFSELMFFTFLRVGHRGRERESESLVAKGS